MEITEEKLKFLEDYQNGTDAEREAMDTRYGKEEIRLMIEEVTSESWMSENCKPCPNCKIPIQVTICRLNNT